MATKASKPVRKSKPKAKSRGAAAVRKGGKTGKAAGKKPTRPASAKPAVRKGAPKTVKKVVAKAKPAAKKPVSKAEPRAKPAAKAAAPKPQPQAKAPAKPVNGKHAAPAAVKAPVPAKNAAPAPAPAPAHKPTASEIAAKLAGRRAEDAATKKGKNGRHAAEAPRELTPADVEARKRRLKTLIVLGKERGYLTYAEINDHLPDDILDAEQIEGVISMIGDMGIQVYDEAPDADTLLMAEAPATVPAEDVEEEAEAAASTLDSEFGRTTDPVRMYMREMGSVELLTREGEIEIAKRIEEGLKHMIMAISACPMTVAQILDLADRIAKDELKIDDLVDGLMDFNEELTAMQDVDDRFGRRGRRRRRRRRDREREPRAPQGRGDGALHGHPQALHAHARRADEGRPQGAQVPRVPAQDLGRAHADPLLGAPGRAPVRQRAHRGRQHPPDRAQDPGPRGEQGRHAAPGLHQDVPDQRDVAALDRPRGRRRITTTASSSPSTARRSSSSSRSSSTCRRA